MMSQKFGKTERESTKPGDYKMGYFVTSTSLVFCVGASFFSPQAWNCDHDIEVTFVPSSSSITSWFHVPNPQDKTTMPLMQQERKRELEREREAVPPIVTHNCQKGSFSFWPLPQRKVSG